MDLSVNGEDNKYKQAVTFINLSRGETFYKQRK